MQSCVAFRQSADFYSNKTAGCCWNSFPSCNMNRYLLNISYIGTKFRGIQKTINKSEEPRPDTTTVRGCIDLALGHLYPANEIKTVLSSRTDAGVHALHSTLHVDLQRRGVQPYDPTAITVLLNRAFDKQCLPIRILSVARVPDTFHCRYNAKGRTYLYRFAVAKDSISDTKRLKDMNYKSFLPVDELDRCLFLQDSTFDIERFRAGSRMLLGLHDFRTFMSVSKQNSPTRDHPSYTVRQLDEINITAGRSLAVGHNGQLADCLYNYWNVEFSAKAFLYKQVRRMMGSLIALATDRIDEKCMYEMLTVPSKNTWNPRILIAPPFGLYLCRVHYDEADLQIQN